MPKYFIRTADGTRGPFPGKEVQALIEANGLQPNDLIRQEGDRHWHPVSAVRGLRGSTASVPIAEQVSGEVKVIEPIYESPPVAAHASGIGSAVSAKRSSSWPLRTRFAISALTVVVALLGAAAIGLGIYHSSGMGLQQDADSFVQAILDGEAGGGARARPYLDRLEASVRSANEARVAEDAEGFINALFEMREVTDGACAAMLARHKAGQATTDQISEFMKALRQNPVVKTLSMGDRQWEQRLLKDQPKRLETLMARSNAGETPMDQLREIMRKEFDAKYERDRLAREAESKRLSQEARKNYEEMNTRMEAERLERRAKSYNLKGRFTVAAQESGKVSFGREYLVPPRVAVWPATESTVLVHEAFYSQSTIVTEVTTTGFSWRCTLDLRDDATRMNVPFNYCDLQWDATGPIRVSDLSSWERIP